MQGTRILLLEDDRETRWALATVLRREGCRVTEAGNGEEGIRFLVRNAYDLVISDCCMPGMGGFGFFAAVRFSDNPDLLVRKTTPILLMSGRVPTRELAQALDAGVDEFMEKPVDPEEFKARVRAVLRRARAAPISGSRTAGELSDITIGALAVALSTTQCTARVKVQSGATTAILDFHKGAIRHAAVDGPSMEARGDSAAIQALSIIEGHFEILPVPDTVSQTVFAETKDLVQRAATRTDDVAKQLQAADTVTVDIAVAMSESAAAADKPSA